MVRELNKLCAVGADAGLLTLTNESKKEICDDSDLPMDDVIPALDDVARPPALCRFA